MKTNFENRLRRIVLSLGGRSATPLVMAACALLNFTPPAGAEEVQTVHSWDDLVERYLEFREQSYLLVVPSWYLGEDQIESVFDRHGLAGFEEQPDWYWNFDGPPFRIMAGSHIAGTAKAPKEVVIYEDMAKGQIVVMSTAGGDGSGYKKVAAYVAPAWPQRSWDDRSSRYLARELSKRRITWRVALHDESVEAEKVALETAADDGGMGSVALMEMLSGETCTAIVFRSLQRQGSGSSFDVELCVPDGIANVDMFATTALLPNGPFWSLAGTNLPVVSNRVVWEWAPCVDSHMVLAAGDATRDTDGDGLQDAREFFLYGSDSMLADTDGDHLPDGWEVENGLNPLDAADAGEDPDRDGWRNLEEYEGGTDIRDRLSNLGFGPQLMINEFVYHPASGQNQWVELFNRNLLPIDLSGFRIQVSDGGSFSTEYVIPSNTVIGAADFLVIAESGGPVTGDVSGALYLEIPYDGTASRTAALRLVGPGTDPVTNDRWVVDACLYDRPNTHSYAQVGFDRYNDEYYAPYAKPGQSLIRSPQGQDLSIGGSEWTWSTNPSPTYAGSLDPDEDGLWTALELSGTMNPYDNRPTDPFAMDSDGDGLSDSAEMAQATDPLDMDTDSDGYPWGTNPYTQDGFEMAYGTSPTNPDSDGDGLYDGWELALGYSPTNWEDHAVLDDDGDGLSNLAEQQQNSPRCVK